MPKLRIDRIEMLRLLPKDATCAEIGVCEGEYTVHILENSNPKRLFLIDIWGHISLGYHDKNMVDNQRQESSFKMI
jgi:hypothetical protein